MRVNFAPLTLESILRSARRDRQMLVGYLLESLIVAAAKLEPEFQPAERRRLEPSRLKVELEPEPPKPWAPRWVRRFTDKDGQSLAEYAVTVALVAVVAIVAIVFLGASLSVALSAIGEAMP